MPNGKRNPSMYGQLPKYLFDALYSAPTAADNENPFVTLADLNSAVGLNNELSEILANGNITDGNDIAVSTGDSITGVVELTLVGAVGVDITATTADVVLTSTAGDVQLSAPSGNIRMRSDVEILDGLTIISATAGVTLDFGSGLELTATAPIFSVVAPIIDLTVTQLKLNLTEYADNAAALGGGLVAGDTYILAATKAVTVVV